MTQAQVGIPQDGETISDEDLRQKEIHVEGKLAFLIENLSTLGDYVYDASVGKLLRQLLSRASTLILNHNTVDEIFDTNESGGQESRNEKLKVDTVFTITIVAKDGKRITRTSSDLLAMFERVYGSPQMKKCRVCGELKTLEEYSFARNNKRDGRNNRCKVCERIRRAAWDAKNRVQSPPQPVVGRFKKCLCCRQSKAVDKFSKDSSRADGVNPYCKTCVHKKYLERRKNAS